MKHLIAFAVTVFVLHFSFFSFQMHAQVGKIGINTTTPQAMLHVKDSSVLFTGVSGSLPVSPGDPPASGAGARMLWYPEKAAFRTGYVLSTNWNKDSIGNYSFGSGYNTKAKGIYSTAMGNSTTASGPFSTAIGLSSIASGSFSTALGTQSNASGDNSTAMGFATDATADYSTALGRQSNAIAESSTALGAFSTASGEYSTAMGRQSRASGNISTSMGHRTYSKAYASLSIGQFNDSINTSNITSWVSTDPVFIIGNGIDDANRSNAITILKNAKTGINTSSPQAMLHVKDSSVLFSGAFTIPGTPGDPPVSGQGIRMMWYPDKAAFRAGYVTNTFWNKDSIGNYSFGSGYNTKAKGNYSTAMGSGSIASEDYATAIGHNTTASGDESTALGYTTTASGFTSTAMGGLTTASGNISTAIGESTTASGYGSTAMGVGTTASGDNSTTMGFYTRSSGNISISMGSQTYSKAFASLSIGRFNDSVNSSSKTNWVSTDPVFIIGNGIDNNNRSNALTVLKNAKMGINMSDPVALLDLKGSDGSINRHIRLEDNNSESSANIYYTADLNFQNNEPGGDFYFKNDAGTNVLSLFSSGNMTILGTLTQNSDSRLKKNIEPLQNSLQKILSLSGYHYNWKENYRDKNLQTGLLAQQVEQQMPELVQEDKEGIKSVNYSGLIPYLLEAVKELNNKLDKEKQRNDLLEKELQQIKKQLR
jgi:hypothetical protein